jgi:hypothetical protein
MCFFQDEKLSIPELQSRHQVVIAVGSVQKKKKCIKSMIFWTTSKDNCVTLITTQKGGSANPILLLKMASIENKVR